MSQDTDRRQAADKPDNYIPIRGASVHSRHKGFLISEAAARDTEELETDSNIFNLRIRKNDAEEILIQQNAAKRAAAIGIYLSAARMFCLLTVAVLVVLFFQETSKPESKVFITASNGKTVRVKTYGSLKEAIAAKVDNEMPIAE